MYYTLKIHLNYNLLKIMKERQKYSEGYINLYLRDFLTTFFVGAAIFKREYLKYYITWY